MKAYEGMEEKPLIETTKNAFKIILPNINAKYEMRNDSAFPTEASADVSVQMPNGWSSSSPFSFGFLRKS